MALSPLPSEASSSGDEVEREELRAIKRRRVEFDETASAKDPGSTFVPPSGLKRAAGDDTLEEFDLVSLKDKLDRGCQLWAIRLPTGLKLRHLSDVQLRAPGGDMNKSEKIGSFHVKKSDYDVYTLGSDPAQTANVGGGELRGLTALVADKKGKYASAPVAISRHLVVKQSVAFPAVKQRKQKDVDRDTAREAVEREKADGTTTRSQPEGLNGFFAPIGSNYQPDLSKKPIVRTRSSLISAVRSADDLPSAVDVTSATAGDPASSPIKREKTKKKTKKTRQDEDDESPRKKRKKRASQTADADSSQIAVDA